MWFSCGGSGGDDDDDADDDSGDDDDAADDDDDDDNAPLFYNGCGIAREAQRDPGTLDEPIDAPYFPFFDRNSLLNAQSNEIDQYDCDETEAPGPEVVYHFEIETQGRFAAEIASEQTVGASMYLLDSLDVQDRTAGGCMEKIDEAYQGTLSPGEYWIVVDATGTPGDYELFFENIVDDQWSHVEIERGVTWSRIAVSELYGSNQSINMIEIEPDAYSDIIRRPYYHGGCQIVSDAAEVIGAFAGTNAGFYEVPDCSPIDMIKYDGIVYSFNSVVQNTMGWDHGQAPEFLWLDPDDPWLDKDNALGGHYTLVENNEILVVPEGGVAPRTAVGIRADGTTVIVTFDGRTEAGEGLTLYELATYLRDELDVLTALNLDGGGSTTMYVRDCSVGGVVNYPSDVMWIPGADPDHHHERPNSDGLYLLK